MAVKIDALSLYRSKLYIDLRTTAVARNLRYIRCRDIRGEAKKYALFLELEAISGRGSSYDFFSSALSLAIKPTITSHLAPEKEEESELGSLRSKIPLGFPPRDDRIIRPFFSFVDEMAKEQNSRGQS